MQSRRGHSGAQTVCKCAVIDRQTVAAAAAEAAQSRARAVGAAPPQTKITVWIKLWV